MEVNMYIRMTALDPVAILWGHLWQACARKGFIASGVSVSFQKQLRDK